MSFEPQKVIEFDKGKQIGQTLTQHADNIPYEDTTVGAELDSINTHLTAMIAKFVAQGDGMTFGADTDGLFIQWRLSATNIFKLSISTSTKYLALANFNGTSWSTMWSGTLN